MFFTKPHSVRACVPAHTIHKDHTHTLWCSYISEHNHIVERLMIAAKMHPPPRVPDTHTHTHTRTLTPPPHTHICMHARTHNTHTCTHNTHTHAHTHTYACTHALTHTHTHTHTHPTHKHCKNLPLAKTYTFIYTAIKQRCRRSRHVLQGDAPVLTTVTHAVIEPHAASFPYSAIHTASRHKEPARSKGRCQHVDSKESGNGQVVSRPRETTETV